MARLTGMRSTQWGRAEAHGFNAGVQLGLCVGLLMGLAAGGCLVLAFVINAGGAR